MQFDERFCKKAKDSDNLRKILLKIVLKYDRIKRNKFSKCNLNIWKPSQALQQCGVLWLVVLMIGGLTRVFATFPVLILKRCLYFFSKTSHGMASAILIQRLFGFIWSPSGWLKSRKEKWDLSTALYMNFSSLHMVFSRKTARKINSKYRNPCNYFTT